MNISKINEEFSKLFNIDEMSISRQEYKDINLKPEKIVQALEKLKSKLVPWPVLVDNQLTTIKNFEIDKSNYEIEFEKNGTSRYISFKPLSQGRLAVIYSFTDEDSPNRFPKYMLKYQNLDDESTYQVIYNLHKEGLSKVVSDTASNFKVFAKYAEKVLKTEVKENKATDKLIEKIKKLVSRAKDNKVKTISLKSDGVRTIQIRPVKRPFNKEVPISGVSINKDSELSFYIDGWKGYKYTFEGNFAENIKVLEGVYNNLETAIGNNKGGNAIAKEQKRIEKEKQMEQQRIEKEKQRIEKMTEIAKDVLYDIRSDMKRVSSWGYWESVRKEFEWYEIGVEDWGYWNHRDEDDDYPSLDREYRDKLWDILKKYNKKYEKQNISFEYDIDDNKHIRIIAHVE